MPYVTQTRTRPEVQHSSKVWRSYANSVWPQSGFTGIGGVTEETYSYRTNRSNLRAGSEYETLSTADLRGSVAYDHRTRYDNGHEFHSTKTGSRLGHPYSSLRTAAPEPFTLHYDGPLWYVINFEDPFPSLNPPGSSQMQAKGQEGFRRSVPNRPLTDVTSFVGELREGLPKLVGARLAMKGVNPKGIADEHLNMQFGILPLIGDIRKLAHGVVSSEKLMKRFVRNGNGGRTVRRKFMLDSDQMVVRRAPVGARLGTIAVNGYDVTQDFLNGHSTVTLDSWDTITSRSWWSGCYDYHVAESNGFLGRMESYGQKARYLLGGGLDASTVWQLTPWSWLVDWHGDIGGFISDHELMAEDNMVLRYAYVMHEAHAERMYANSFPMYTGDGSIEVGTVTQSYYRNSKQRVRGGPYGFNLAVENYTSRQWGIIGALGLSKSATSLRRV